MNIPPSEAKALTLWEYEAVLVEWNIAHDPNADVEPPTNEQWVATKRFFEDNPQFLN